MKLQYTKDYLLLINEKAAINFNDYWIYDNPNIPFDEIVSRSKINEQEWFNKLHDRSSYKKVTAYFPLTKEAKELDLPLLPDPFKLKIDEKVHLKNLSNECFLKMKELNPSGGIKEFIKIAVEYGYKAAQSDKQFSLDDIKNALQAGVNIGIQNVEKPRYENDFNFNQEKALEESKKYIQSLSTQQLPKEFIPEYEQINLGAVFNGRNSSIMWSDPKLKIIINSSGKKELVGEYGY